MKHRGKTPSFHGPSGEVLLGSIAEIDYHRLGGIDQWVMIRGRNVTNPILVLLHGGPGFPEMRLFRTFNAPLEDNYTVVYWEQRGTDKSFSRSIPPASMTVGRFLADLDELVDVVRRRFRKESVVLYGHSWGSALGVLYAARFPHKVAAYIGTGQIGDWPASELSSYAFVLAEAERRNKRKALRELRAIGKPPHTFDNMLIQRKWLMRFVGIVRGMSMWRFARILLGGPEASIIDLPNILRGSLWSPNLMWAEISALDLTKTVPALQMPVFFFLGRHDHVVAPETSAAYFEILSAPLKRIVWFEESAHEPTVEEADKFNTAMVGLVLPTVQPTL
ncbi:MAG: alpha/beta hydrolase [Nitrospira sp.]